MSVDAKRICAGTFGEVWVDDELFGECYKAQAKIEFNKEEVKQCGVWASDHKILGYKGTGSLTLYKVNTRMTGKIADREQYDAENARAEEVRNTGAFHAENGAVPQQKDRRQQRHSAKVADEELIVLDSLTLDAIKTKEMANVVNALETGRKVLFVLPDKNDIIYRSARNIAGVKTTLVNTLNVYDILNCDTVVVLKDAVSKIEEVYA